MGVLRRNAVALLALALVISGGSAWAGAKIGSNQIASNAVKSRHLAKGAVRTADLGPNAATGRKIAEGTLGPVPDARSVGGIRVRPVRAALATNETPIQIADVSGSRVEVGCTAGLVTFQYLRQISGPPFTAVILRAGDHPVVAKPPPSAGASLTTGSAGRLTVTVREGGRVLRVTVDGFAEVDAFGGSDDCFYQGTIESFG